MTLGVSPRAARRVPGVEGIWVFIGGDLALFTLLFGSYMSARMHQPGLFDQSQHALDPTRGGANTLLLLSSSWCVVQSLQSARLDRHRKSQRWLALAIFMGAGFAVSKVVEYVVEVGAGHTPTSDDFFMYYFMLTGIHLAHVIAGCVAMAVLLYLRRSEAPDRGLRGFESVAVFWHLVDLLWFFLFALLYLVS